MLRHPLVFLSDLWPGFRHVPSWLMGRTHASLQVHMHKRAATDKPSSQPSPQKHAVIPVHSLPMVTCIPSDEGPKAGLQDEAEQFRGQKGSNRPLFLDPHDKPKKKTQVP